MDEITIGQLLAANWVLLACVLGGALVLVAWLLVRRRRRVRRLPATIGGVRITCEGAVMDADHVLEQDWRVTLLLRNVTRRPAEVPVLSSRGVVKAGRREYAGSVYFEGEVSELNPGESVVVWVVVRVPAGESPRKVVVELAGGPRVVASCA